MSTPRPNWRERGYDREYDRNRPRILRQETHCWICGQPVDRSLSGRHPDGPSVDHVIPRHKGGTNARDNLRLSHLRCNTARTGLEQPKRRRPTAERHPGLLDPDETP